jgi:hypothetical protein
MSAEIDDAENSNAITNNPTVALLGAAAVGFALGAVIWQYRRTPAQRFGSFDRAIDMARSGAIDTVQGLRRRLREEGYSPADIEGRAKKFISQLIDSAQRHL